MGEQAKQPVVQCDPSKPAAANGESKQQGVAPGARGRGFDRLGWLLVALLALITWLVVPDREQMQHANAQQVFFFSWLTALSTGCGVLPFFFFPTFNDWWLGVCNAFAGGMMLAASWSLFVEGVVFDEDVAHPASGALTPLTRVALGAVAGALFIVVTQRFLHNHEELQFGDLRGASAHKILLFIFVMTLHSVSEGVSIGVSFGGKRGLQLGQFISMSLAVHNVPEGLAVGLVIKGGQSVLRTGLWAVLTSIPQPIMAVPAFMFVETFTPLLPVGLGFAGGAMLWVAVFELLQEALEKCSLRVTGASCAAACALMLSAQHLLR